VLAGCMQLCPEMFNHSHRDRYAGCRCTINAQRPQGKRESLKSHACSSLCNCCRDRQPPFVVQNATGCAVDVGFFPPSEASDGSFSYAAAPRSALRVSWGELRYAAGQAAAWLSPALATSQAANNKHLATRFCVLNQRHCLALQVGAGHTLECDFQPSRRANAGSNTKPCNSGSGSGDEGGSPPADGPLSPVKRGSSGGATGGWADQEDEDAFLDCLLRVGLLLCLLDWLIAPGWLADNSCC